MVWEALALLEKTLGKDGGGSELGPMNDYKCCVAAEYVWLDAYGVPRSKTKTLSKKPVRVDDYVVVVYIHKSSMHLG